MAKMMFKKGSTPYTLHLHFMAGNSLTGDEAYEMEPKIRHLSQRISDLSNKFTDAGVPCLIMVHDEPNGRGGTHARYFYKGVGCPLERKPGARMYR